ncbi:MAG: hypothetical protein K0S56_1446 [Microvirga sp.]|jgi:hypothetical protein|nr:hypothetical protein [Microvirga sp.]
MSDLLALLEELRDERRRIIAAMTSGNGWTDEHIRDLADIQTAIAAVEAQMAEMAPPDDAVC